MHINHGSYYQANEKGVKRLKLALKALVNIETGKYTKVANINGHILPRMVILKCVAFNIGTIGYLQIGLDGAITIYPNVNIPANQMIYIDETYV